MVVDLDPRSHWDIFQESTVIGLSGLRSVGHATPPPWMPDGISPFFRTAAWSQLWQAGDTRVLPSMGARWLLTSRQETAEKLRQNVREEFLKEVESFGEVTLWRYLGALDSLDVALPEVELAGVEIARPEEMSGEVAQPMVLVLKGVPPETEVDLSLSWIPREGTDPGGAIEPLTLRDRSPRGQAPWRFRHALVPPLVEGRYRLEVRLNGHLLSPPKELEHALNLTFDWTSQAQKARARLDPLTGLVEFSAEEGLLRPPLNLGMRLFRLDEERYSRPFGFEAQGLWSGQQQIQLEPTDPQFTFPVPEGQRPDLYLLDRSGRQVRLGEP